MFSARKTTIAISHYKRIAILSLNWFYYPSLYSVNITKLLHCILLKQAYMKRRRLNCNQPNLRQLLPTENTKNSPGIIPGLCPKSSISITLQLYYSEDSDIIAPSHLDGRRCVLSYLNKRDCFSFLWKGGRYRWHLKKLQYCSAFLAAPYSAHFIYVICCFAKTKNNRHHSQK